MDRRQFMKAASGGVTALVVSDQTISAGNEKPIEQGKVFLSFPNGLIYETPMHHKFLVVYLGGLPLIEKEKCWGLVFIMGCGSRAAGTILGFSSGADGKYVYTEKELALKVSGWKLLDDMSVRMMHDDDWKIILQQRS